MNSLQKNKGIYQLAQYNRCCVTKGGVGATLTKYLKILLKVYCTFQYSLYVIHY